MHCNNNTSISFQRFMYFLIFLKKQHYEVITNEVVNFEDTDQTQSFKFDLNQIWWQSWHLNLITGSTVGAVEVWTLLKIIVQSRILEPQNIDSIERKKRKTGQGLHRGPQVELTLSTPHPRLRWLFLHQITALLSSYKKRLWGIHITSKAYIICSPGTP